MKTQHLNLLNQIKFEDFATTIRKLLNSIDDKSLIFKIENGYRIFDHYEIRQTTDNNWIVVWDFGVADFEFHKLINALTFCIFKQIGKYNIAMNIHKLDNQYADLQFDISNKIYQLKKYNEMDYEIKSVILTKLNENVRQSKQIKMEIKKHINLAKYLKVMVIPISHTIKD